MADKPKKKKGKLAPRQRAFIKQLATGKSLTDAAVAAGYKSKSPGSAGHQALKQIQKNGAGADLLDRFGLTDDVLITKYLIPLLEAEETKFFQSEGKVVETRKVVDLTTRRFALEMAFRIKGLFKAEQENTSGIIKCFLIDRSKRPPLKPAIDIPTLKPEESNDTTSR